MDSQETAAAVAMLHGCLARALFVGISTPISTVHTSRTTTALLCSPEHFKKIYKTLYGSPLSSPIEAYCCSPSLPLLSSSSASDMEALTISELMTFLRFSFQLSDFRKAETLLLQKDAEKARLQSEHETLTAELTALRNRAAELEERAGRAEEEAEEKFAKMENVYKGLKYWKKKATQKDSEKARLQSEHETLTAKLTALRNRAAELEERAGRAEEEAEEKRAEAEQKFAKMENVYKELKYWKKKATEELETCRRITAEIEEKIKSGEEEKEEWQRKEEVYRQRIAEMEAVAEELVEVKAANLKLAAEVEEWKRKWGGLEVENKSLEEKGVGLMDERGNGEIEAENGSVIEISDDNEVVHEKRDSGAAQTNKRPRRIFISDEFDYDEEFDRTPIGKVKRRLFGGLKR